MPFVGSNSGTLIAPGPPGASEYEIWLGAGNVGTINDFLLSLRGIPGPPGPSGPPGAPGGGGSGVTRHTAVNDTSYTIQPTDVFVAMVTLSAPRTLTLPAANAYPVGQALYIADESGNCSSTLYITIAANGSNTIAGQASLTMAAAYQKLTFHTNGINLWTFA